MTRRPDISATAAHARPRAPVPRPALLERLAQEAIAQLTAGLSSVLGRVDDALFDFMQSSGQRSDPTRYIDAMRELRLRRERIESRFAEQLGEGFEALRHGRTRLADFATGEPQTDSENLSLVSEEELEVQLAARQLSQSLQHYFGALFSQLDQRVGWLAGGLELGLTTNPLGPNHIAAAIHAATCHCDVPLHVKLILYKLCERELGPALEEAFHALNEWLIEAGVLPALPALRLRRDAARRRRARNPLEIDFGDGEEEEEEISESQARELFATLHHLLGRYRHLHFGPEPAAGSGQARRPLLPDEVLGVLSLLQADMSPALKAALESGTESLAQRVKAEVLACTLRLGLDPTETRLDPLDEDAIDLVSMLFEVLLDEREIQGRGRALVGRLVVPFVKVALMDRKMFLRKTHPARRLLNALAEACEQNPGETPAERELLAKAEEIVERLIAEFNENLAIFEVLLEELNAYLEQHRKRVELAERRAAEAQRGRERLEQARERVFTEVETRIAGRRMPPSLELLLRSYWSHHLMVVSLRHGEASEDYRAGLSTGDALIACLDEAHYGMAGLLGGLSGLRPGLERILASSGVTGESAMVIIRAVTEELRQIARGETPGERPAATITASVPPPMHSPVETEPEPPVLRLVSNRDDLDYDPEDAERVRALAVGTWVELVDEQGQRQAVKLAWISPISSRLMFVNKRGLRVCVASVEELAVLMRQNRFALRPNDPAFERAMQQVLGRLRQPSAAAA